MNRPLISVILTPGSDASGTLRALRSIFAQTYRPLEVIVSGSGSMLAQSALTSLAAVPPQGITVRMSRCDHANGAAAANTGLAAATGDYLCLITAADEYTPERIERCLAAARDGSVVVTHLMPVGADAQPLKISDPWRVQYDRTLIHHIGVFPNVSCLAMFMDVVITVGNLFFSRETFSAVGPFSDYPNFYYLDFFLRAIRLREPALLREKLLVHRPRKKMPIDEHAEVLRNHMLMLWSETPPANPLADVFTAHAFLTGQLPWTKPLNKAFDGLLEYRKLPRDRTVAGGRPGPARSGGEAREFTLVTHELSLTGAPVIVLEMASLLREWGALVRVLSLKDGPLKSEFKRRGFRIVTPPVVLDRISRLHDRTLHWSRLGNRLPERLVNLFAAALHRMCERAWQLQLWLHAKGTLIINSIASWPLAAKLPAAWRQPAYWYIHESLDPQWLMPGERANSRLKGLVAGGRLKMIFGSEATRQHWTGNSFDGLVRYWSGITRNTAYLGPASARRNAAYGAARRVILNVGSSSGRKGTRTLIEAFALGRREGFIPLDAQLCVVGCALPSANAEARDLVRRVHQPDLRGHVRLVHNVEPAVLPSYYEEADVYAHASIFDCMPLAVLTAMAHGLPVVATDVDGCKEALVNAHCGLLVRPGELREMAQAMGRLLTEPEYAAKLGHAARDRFISTFSAEATFPPLYDTLVGNPLPG